jgi:hypothetical protein
MILADPRNPRGIVWIASYPASGNTWIRLFLYHLMRAMTGVPNLGGEINNVGMASLYEIQQVGLFKEFLGKPVKEATWQEIAAIRPKVQDAIVKRSKGIALVKTHSLLGGVQGMELISLGVAVGSIYIVRDPRDVAVSLASHFRVPVDKAISILGTSAYRTETSEKAVFEIWGSWSQNVQSWTMKASDARLDIRYEDLITDPAGQLTAVAKHLGQAPTPEQLQDAIESVAFERLQQEERQAKFAEYDARGDRLFRVGKAGQWREKLTKDQADKLVGAHGEMMRRFGYLPH